MHTFRCPNCYARFDVPDDDKRYRMKHHPSREAKEWVLRIRGVEVHRCALGDDLLQLAPRDRERRLRTA